MLYFDKTMKQDWHPEELDRYWTLSSEERDPLGNKTGATRLGLPSC